MSTVNETRAAIGITLRSIPQRLPMSFATVVGIALVVLVLLGFLAMANGFRKTLDGTGSDQVLIVMNKGAQTEIDSMISSAQYRALEDAPGIARDAGGALLSAEVYTVISAAKRGTREPVNVALRGISPQGLKVRSGFNLSEGRIFAPGSQEIVIGRSLQRRLEGFELGRTVKFGPSEWTISGIVDAGGSALESEIWGDVRVVQSLFNMENAFQTVRLRGSSPDTAKKLDEFFNADPRLGLQVKSERAFFATQSRGLIDMLRYLGWPLALLMALGALAGALNTMHSSVSARASEIATLRTIGFGSFSTFIGVMAEALVLSIAGALLGVVLALLFLQDMTASTVANTMTTLSFRLQLSVDIVVAAIVLALSVGLLGGAVAAFRAARQPILQGLAR